jgi:glycine/D-amino acid oxidase-like deaminating enzyme
MTDTADVVIIGGGIVGSSVAYHLAEAGCTNVLLVEREAHQGLGSTGKSAGGVRAQFATEINIRMSVYSINFFEQFQEETGQDIGYRPHGYLFVATKQRHLEYLNSNRNRQQACGLNNVDILAREDILKILPQIRADDVVGGSFCPTDGFVDPYSMMTAFASRARERGVALWLGTEVTGIDVESGRVSGVVTSRGHVATRAVVNAGGPWAGIIARLAGIEIPVTPLRRQLVHTQPFDLLPARLPMVIDMSNGFHFRPEGPGFLLAWPDEQETTGFNTQFDPEFIEKILIRAVNRVPCFAEAEVNPRRCWAGLYEVTPDHHAIIGRAPGVEGLFLANGFSGHGVMHSPATGRIVSELILDGESHTIDAAALGAERFAEDRLLHETAIL